MEITKEQFNKLPNPLKLYFELKTENVPRLNVAYERRCDNNFGGGKDKRQGTITGEISLGRFPANLIHDNSEEVRECFPETNSKWGKSSGVDIDPDNCSSFKIGLDGGGIKERTNKFTGDSGNASRFFKSIIYQAKASKSERNKGCEGLEEKQYSHDGRDKEIENPYQRNKSVATNNHPTVKPISLMKYLIKMVTPKGGIVLDPFAGSGSTLVAAKQNGFQYIGIEKEPEYIEIINKRLNP